MNPEESGSRSQRKLKRELGLLSSTLRTSWESPRQPRRVVQSGPQEAEAVPGPEGTASSETGTPGAQRKPSSSAPGQLRQVNPGVGGDSGHRVSPTRSCARRPFAVVTQASTCSVPRTAETSGSANQPLSKSTSQPPSSNELLRKQKPLAGTNSEARPRGRPAGLPGSDSIMSSSQRSRGQRGANRNSEDGEMKAIYQSIQSQINTFVQTFNDSSKNVLDIRDEEKRVAEKKDAGGSLVPDLAPLDAVLRKGVKINDEGLAQVKKIIEETKILSALQKAKEKESLEQSLPRSTSRAKDSAPASSVYDFDGSGDSPVPSPNPSVARRMAGSSGGKADRSDSVPPKLDRSTPKAGSVEPQGPAAGLARSKVTFAKGDEVAFRPKPQNNEQTDWILGIVEDVRGEGKSRRYKVLDADVDDAGEKKTFRTSASSMIAIPKDGTPLPPLENKKLVLALYPNTTTFYKAEVMSMDGDGKVNLKFEGEESSNTMQAVGRRHVVEYRA